MFVIDAPHLIDVSVRHFTTRFPWLRALVLGILLAISLVIALILAHITPLNPNAPASLAPFNITPLMPFLQIWAVLFVPYAIACALVFLSKPSRGRWRWIEIGLIMLGAVILRALFLPLPPNLSHDSWRYVWDARVFLHGYSPYVAIPASPALKPLRDFIYAYSRFRAQPSLYPPGAQYVYILSYLIVPSSLYFLKFVFFLFDLTSCGVLAILLARKGLDPARVLLYAWCPLPIVEFALQGHVDVLPITFTLLALLTARDTRWRGRALTGFLIGMGTLTKIYPIVMLVAVVRLHDWKRDWLLIATCLLTIVVGYLPFFIQGHGQIFGFFSSYTNEQGQNAGIVQLAFANLGHNLHATLQGKLTLEHLGAFVLVGGAALAIFILRQSERISIEAGTLILFALILAVSSHVFPWYTTTLLPLIALLLPARGQRRPLLLWLARLLALCALWLFTATSILSYTENWPLYYHAAYDLLEIELSLAALFFLLFCFFAFRQKGSVYAKR